MCEEGGQRAHSLGDLAEEQEVRQGQQGSGRGGAGPASQRPHLTVPCVLFGEALTRTSPGGWGTRGLPDKTAPKCTS